MVSLAYIGRGVVDGLANFVSGIGTGKDKASQYVYTYSPLDQRTIEAAYATDWLARKIIDVLPQDMTREWRVWQWDKASDCYELEKTLKVRTKVRRALKLARLYGGSAILIGDGSDRPEKPLDVERIGKGDLKYLHVFSRHQLSNDRERVKELKNADYGLPEFYRIAAQGYSSGRRDLDQIVVHRSRFVFFEGAEPPDSIRDQNSGWGLPLYQSILEAVTAANAAAKNAASLVEEAKLDIITMPDLGSVLATDEGAKRLTERFTLANVLKSTVNTLLLGEGETFERKQISFAGLVDLMNANMQIASGAADVPITRLLGQSPAGLNATGESDLRNYYDHVRSLQTTDLSESLDTLDEALIRSVAGRRPDEAMYEWEALRQETDEEKARNALVKAQTTQIYLNLGLFTDQELRPAVADQLIEDGIYPTLDQYLLSDEEREQADLEEHQAEIDKQQKQLEMQTAVAGPPKEAPQLRVVGKDEEEARSQDHSPFEASDTWNEGDHPREPAGSSEGGRFASGSGGEGSEGISEATSKKGMDRKEALTRAREVANKLGYPADMIKIGAEKAPDREFELNGKKYMAAGLAHIKDDPGGPPKGTIRIFPDGLSAETVGGVVAHEVMHQKWQVVSDEFNRQRKQIENKAIEADDAKIYNELHPVLFGGDNWEKLKREDGVTPYSKEYWKQANEAPSFSSLRVAIHETLAEIARIDFESQVSGKGKMTVARVTSGLWGTLYKAVQKHYEALK